MKSQNKLDNDYIKNISKVSLKFLIFFSDLILFLLEILQVIPFRATHWSSLKWKTKCNKMLNLLDLFDLNQVTVTLNYNNSVKYLLSLTKNKLKLGIGLLIVVIIYLTGFEIHLTGFFFF